MTLRRRLAVLLGATGLLLVAVVGLAAALLLQVRDSQDRVVDDFFTATVVSNELFVTVLDAETAVRGYALTGDEAQLGPLTPREGAPTGEDLRALLAGEPEVLARLDVAGETATTWYEDFALPLVETVRAGGPAAVEPGEIERGRVLFDAVRVDYGTYLASLVDARMAALGELRDRTTRLFAVVVGAALLAAVAAVALVLATRRWVVDPLSALGADVRRVRAGDLEHRITALGPPEIRSLALDVDDMRGALLWRLAEVEQASRDVELAREQLIAQAGELERSNRDLEQFAYVASHDLQEPLRKVASFCQLLQRRYEGQLDERADSYIAFAVDGAKRMQQLINDLLTFSRVGRGGTAPEPVSLQVCLDRALGSLSIALEESGATVTSGDLPEVLGEAPLLVQLLQNLVGNAIKFRTEEPPVVRVEAAPAGDGMWELSVRDNGIGIDEQYADRVFVIFQRLHPKDRYEGTGIGLAMCKKIVEHHGGEIALAPAPGGGTVVTCTLPAVPEDAPEPADPDVDDTDVPEPFLETTP